MSENHLESKMRSTGLAYVLWFVLGAHYAYLGKWGLQILYWVTLGGLGIWAIVDLFRIPGKVDKYNAALASQVDTTEKMEKAEDHSQNVDMATASQVGG